MPISNYGAMKAAGEACVSAFAHAGARRAWIFRFPNVVGPRSTHGVIRDLICKLMKDPERLEVLGDGTQQKPYLHVTELLDAMLFISRNHSGPLGLYNIGPNDAGVTYAASQNGCSKRSLQGRRSPTPVAIEVGLEMCRNFATTYRSCDRWDGRRNSDQAMQCNVLSQRSKLSWHRRYDLLQPWRPPNRCSRWRKGEPLGESYRRAAETVGPRQGHNGA